jgi:hypothetical protein
MRRPRNPVPPNTVTRREDMTRKYRAALGYAIIFSALPEAKQASAQARRIRRVTPSDEFQACARPSIASGTEGSNPAPSSRESSKPHFAARASRPRTVRPSEHEARLNGVGGQAARRNGSFLCSVSTIADVPAGASPSARVAGAPSTI